MVVGAKVCELTDGFLWFVCGLYVGILTSPLKAHTHWADFPSADSNSRATPVGRL